MKTWSAKANDEFISMVISTDLLDDAVNWISNHLSPDEVFDSTDLENWAEDNGYTREE